MGSSLILLFVIGSREAVVADPSEDAAAVRAALEENADEPIPFGDDVRIALLKRLQLMRT